MLSATSLLLVALAAGGSQSSAPPPDRPLTHIFQNLGHDVRHLPSRDSALALAIGGGSAIVLHAFDDNVADWVAGKDEAAYAKLGRFAGDGWVQGGIVIGTYVAGLASHNPETTHIGSDFIRAAFLNAILTRAMKITIDRTRPSGGGHSLPSGHSSAAFTLAAVLDSHYGWKGGVPSYALAGFIAWTRVREDEHWLTDDVVGATLGIIVGHTVARGHSKSSWTLMPSVSPNRVAVFVTRGASSRR